jgi:hypothetical protein
MPRGSDRGSRVKSRKLVVSATPHVKRRLSCKIAQSKAEKSLGSPNGTGYKDSGYHLRSGQNRCGESNTKRLELQKDLGTSQWVMIEKWAADLGCASHA